MKICYEIKQKAKELKKEITALYYAYQNPEVKLLPKIIIILTLGYMLSPIDLIPDFIPVIGYLDDLIVIPALISLSIRLIPESVMNNSREIAGRKPVKLKKNWFFATLFILIWIILLSTLILSIWEVFF